MSFEAQDGRITGLLGHNGAGKSTTLRILSTVLRPDTGRAVVDGHDCVEQPLQVRRSLGVLPHASGLYAHLTGRENIRYYGKLHGLQGAELDRMTDELIERLGLGAVAGRRAKGYSQGERLKVALARALVHQPRTIILDEPTNGLDVNAVRMLRDLVRELRASGRCVLFSSHVMQEVAALCDDIVIISHGRVVVRGTPARDPGGHRRRGPRGSVRARRRLGCARMTRAVRIVFAKEMLENLRDRRVILSAFLFGVLLAPVIFGLTTSLASKRVVENQDKPLRLTVSGIEHAPNLVRFLEENGTEIKTVTMTSDEAMQRGAPRRRGTGPAARRGVRQETAGWRARAARPRRGHREQPDRCERGARTASCSKRMAVSSQRCVCSCAASARKWFIPSTCVRSMSRRRQAARC